MPTPYAPIIAPGDLSNIIYPEVITEITRNDGGVIATKAIAIGIAEVKMYLTRYDIVQLFGDATVTEANPEGIAATFSDPYLTQMCEYVCLWHLIQLANPNINYDSAKLLYEQTIDSLKRIQKGLADPRWPYQDTTGETTPKSDQVTVQQAPCRDNFYY